MPRRTLPSLQTPSQLPSPRGAAGHPAGGRYPTWAWRVAICFSRFRLASSSSSSCSLKEFFSSSICFSLVLRLSFCRFSSWSSSYTETRGAPGLRARASRAPHPPQEGGAGPSNLEDSCYRPGWRGAGGKRGRRTQRPCGCWGGWVIGEAGPCCRLYLCVLQLGLQGGEVLGELAGLAVRLGEKPCHIVQLNLHGDGRDKAHDCFGPTSAVRPTQRPR